MPVGQLRWRPHRPRHVWSASRQLWWVKFLACWCCCLVFVHPELLIWAILLFFIPAVDEPALNDVSELDDRRDMLGLLALTLLVMIVLPAPGHLLGCCFSPRFHSSQTVIAMSQDLTQWIAEVRTLQRQLADTRRARPGSQ
jgi:hypothetical protein